MRRDPSSNREDQRCFLMISGCRAACLQQAASFTIVLLCQEIPLPITPPLPWTMGPPKLHREIHEPPFFPPCMVLRARMANWTCSTWWEPLLAAAEITMTGALPAHYASTIFRNNVFVIDQHGGPQRASPGPQGHPYPLLSASRRGGGGGGKGKLPMHASLYLDELASSPQD
ncbi:uncharacterized protein LY79DRAFT_66094 [Colletotrichum navitas]|uniref:Uncharacterized protein n=1 Tax=Colletotrichum navitas TaxID=681940 RepID=A0AAD8PLN6_9PEZI|nr:uncharacterized protein LY79DRAFT_66094 [Colletotrichum navitas]KAK1569886.1 hypothetical protein LY79DRAFT_66094 [Colletotrichum navitas]